MQVGGGAEELQETILISIGSGTSTRAVYVSIFARVAAKENVKVGSEGE